MLEVFSCYFYLLLVTQLNLYRASNRSRIIPKWRHHMVFDLNLCILNPFQKLHSDNCHYQVAWEISILAWDKIGLFTFHHHQIVSFIQIVGTLGKQSGRKTRRRMTLRRKGYYSLILFSCLPVHSPDLILFLTKLLMHLNLRTCWLNCETTCQLLILLDRARYTAGHR